MTPWSGVFAKRPVPGRVKTRLVPPLTDEQAARLQAAMLDDAVERLASGTDSWRAVLAFAPAEDAAWFTERYPDLLHVAQEGEGLGQRMAHFFEDALHHARSVVMTGSDQPLVPASAFHAAHAALADGADLVLGPDRGGGYYLIGLRQSIPALFNEVVMSTAGMFAQTCEVAEQLGLRVHRLGMDLDVDDVEDLEHLSHVLGGTKVPPHTTHTHAALVELGRLEARS